MRINKTVLSLFLFGLSGCYVDKPDDRIDGMTAQGVDGRRPLPAGDCHLYLGRGCFDGHVAAKTGFFVSSKAFLNADDLAARFDELYDLKAGRGEGLDTAEVLLTITTPLDNTTFFSGFEFNLVGPVARQGKVKSDGNFSVSDLPEGSYDLRVQRAVHFTLKTRKVTPSAGVALGQAGNSADGKGQATSGDSSLGAQGGNPSSQGQEGLADVVQNGPADVGQNGVDPGAKSPASSDRGVKILPQPKVDRPPNTESAPVGSDQKVTTVTTEKHFCGTLYQDSAFEVRVGERRTATLNDFRLQINDKECTPSGQKITLSD